jgi:outer membrane protein OmpA-like peptidoglycan-associated protein
MRRTLPLLAAALLVSGCGSLVRGSWPGFTDSPIISDATIRISPGYTLTVEKIVFSAAGAALLYTLYDPLAPNWTLDEEAIGEDTYRLTLNMKRFIIGGEGEALALLRRWAEAVQHEGQYDGYRIDRFEQGIDSGTPVARRYAHATVRMTRLPQPGLPAVQITRADPTAAVDLRNQPDKAATAGAVEIPQAEPLPRPPPRPGFTGPFDDGLPGVDAAGDADGLAAAADGTRDAQRLPRPPAIGVSQVMLNARVLFAFDSATLTPAGRQVLEREVVANRAELGRMAVLLVSGHTDRIGSYAYNQRLSEARARAVRSFLLGRGFDEKRVLSVGYGKTRPLAGFPCDETLPRGALVECLAPQRRVELEFADAN